MTTVGEGSATPASTLTALPGRRLPAINEQTRLRAVMAQFATGVTVLTAGGEQAHGMTANAFTSVSLSPPMVLCCVSRAARMHSAILAADSFAVSILAADQGDVARHFADWRRPTGMAQFDSVKHCIGVRTGAPVMSGALGWIECDLVDVYAGGDHAIFLGAVLGCGTGTAAAALSFFGGDYHRLGSPERAAG